MVRAIDHVVLTVRDIDEACEFYARVLGLEVVTFAGGRRALQVGAQKINLQTIGMEPRNHACIGSGDLCLITDATPTEVVARLHEQRVAVVEGPVEKTGARGTITSVYFNDPWGNLIEVSSYGAA
ncbi:MAG: VOC family virulence protein [Rhodobacteraceae bacterium]|nr:VOC family virulence protein [Paracoccaceae bacterium]MBR26714.1 VOC family virulence protein [Paracoccaceae bacterium]MBR29564.1 VOC family virulence protein [Paracoccaceae bacterium]